MESSLTLRIIDVPRYTEEKIARKLGDRLGPFIGGDAYTQSNTHMYRFMYLSHPMSVDPSVTFPPRQGIQLLPPQAGLDYIKFTLTLVPVPVYG